VISPNVFHNESLLPIEKVRLSPGQAGLICGLGDFHHLAASRAARLSRTSATGAARKGRRYHAPSHAVHCAKVRAASSSVTWAEHSMDGARTLAAVYGMGRRVIAASFSRRRQWRSYAKASPREMRKVVKIPQPQISPAARAKAHLFDRQQAFVVKNVR